MPRETHLKSILAGLLFAVPGSVSAQLCLDIFEELTDPAFSCADGFYFVESPEGDPDSSFLADSSSGLLGADFDGFDLFDPNDPELAPPDNLLEPFFSDIQYKQTNIGGQINSFQARHRGSVSMGPRDSISQATSYGTLSRLTFIPLTTDESTDPVTVDLGFHYEVTLESPSENATSGVSVGAAGARIFDEDPDNPIFICSTLVDLDLEFSAEPTFTLDCDGAETSFEPAEPDIEDKFDIEIDFTTSFQATPGEPLVLDTEAFGLIFTDGFESGDVSAWSVSSVDTFEFTVSSANPNVRFRLVTTDSDFPMNAGLNGNWWNGPARNGEGAQIEVADAGDGNLVLVATMYSYDTNGNQIFMIAVGPVNGSTAEVDVFITSGGRWGDDFDPAEVNETQWGTGTFTANSCESMHMELRPNAEFQAMGYTHLAYDLVRLVTPVIPCPIENPD